MEIKNFIEIREIASISPTENTIQSAANKVNELLSEGWYLINTYTTCYDAIIAKEQQTLHYVLGITYESKIAHSFSDEPVF